MLDDKANKAMNEVLQRGAALIEALNLTAVETEYAMQDAQWIITKSPRLISMTNISREEK